MPRGRSLGMVMQLSDGDQTSMSRKQVGAVVVNWTVLLMM